MADFDPFSINQDQKDTDMPVFGSFDTMQTSKDDQKESSIKEKENKDQDSFFSTFAPFDSGPSNTPDDDQGFPTFESFDSGPKQFKEDDSMPTFESFVTSSIDSKGNSTSQSKPPTFDSDSDDNNNNDIILNNNKDKEPLYASFGESIHSISNAAQEEENIQKEEENVQQEEENAQKENSSLNFPAFGSFPAFESTEGKDVNSHSKNNIDSNKSPIKEKNSSAIPEKKPKVQQQESKLAAVQTLPSVKSLLKPIPGSQPTLSFYPDHAKISIQPPKPFKETTLAKELSEYCMKVFNHQYVFTD